jgi:hypothetical protein
MMPRRYFTIAVTACAHDASALPVNWLAKRAKTRFCIYFCDMCDVVGSSSCTRRVACCNSCTVGPPPSRMHGQTLDLGFPPHETHCPALLVRCHRTLGWLQQRYNVNRRRRRSSRINQRRKRAWTQVRDLLRHLLRGTCKHPARWRQSRFSREGVQRRKREHQARHCCRRHRGAV